jgi:iron complex outermembrane receptor protein
MLSLVAIAGILTNTGKAQATATTTPTSTADEMTNTAPQEPQVLGKFVVTGSNLQVASDRLAIPLTVIGQQDIETSGVADNTLDLLRKLSPAVGGLGVENATISTNETYGGSLINIHGLSVLVLVNGHRIASDSAEAVGADRFSDLNMIPPSAIDHIDMLQDGASAIYGSDAVGGVINIILKNQYNGWEAGFHYGMSPTNGHYTEKNYSITGGVSNGTTSMTLSAEYANNTPIFFNQRPYTNPYYANDYIPGVIDIYNLATGIDEDYTLAPGVNAPPGGGKYSINQLIAMGVYVDRGDDANPATEAAIIPGILNFADDQTLIESLKRTTVVANISHKIFGDALEFTADLQYSKTITRSELNAQPIYPYVSDPYTDVWYNGGPPTPGEQYVLYTSPGNPFSQAYLDQKGDFNPVTGTGTGYGVDAHDRFIQFPRLFENDSTLFSGTAGLDGKVGSRYSWQAFGTLSRYDLDYANQNLIDAANFYAALANGSLNPFAINQAPGVLPGNILGTGTATALSTLSEGTVIVNGTPFDLPAGAASFAVGTSYTREVLSANADLNTEDHLWINSPTIIPVDKSRSNLAFFAEIGIPIFSKENKIPGIYALNLDVAGRIEDYYNVGTSRIPKVSLKYEPYGDELSLRFSAGKSFIAPTLYSLYGPVNLGSSQSVNYTPYGTTTELHLVQFESQTGSNPDLKPSTATTWTAGIGYTPTAVPGLSATADFFDTHQTGLPYAEDQQTIVQSVEDLGATSPYASDIHFNSPTGPTPTAPGQISGHPKSQVWIIAPTINQGGTLTRGFDATLEYVAKTYSFGKFDIKTTGTIYNTVQLEELPIQPYYSYLGDTSANEGTVPHWHTFSTVDWTYKGFDFTINHFFAPSLNDVGPGGEGATAPIHVASYSQFDASVAYTFSKARFGRYFDGVTIRVGFNNLFGAEPPVARNAETETTADIGYYGAIGQLAYGDLTYKF